MGRKKYIDAKRELAAKKEAVNIKNEFISSKGNPEEELKIADKLISEKTNNLNSLNDKKTLMLKEKSLFDGLLEQKRLLGKESDELSAKCTTLKKEIESSENVIKDCDMFLQHADDIRAKSKRYKEITDLLSEIQKDVAVWESERGKLEDIKKQQLRYQNVLNNCNIRNSQIDSEIKQLNVCDAIDLDKKLQELEAAKEELDELSKKEKQTYQIEHELMVRKMDSDRKIQDIRMNLSVAYSNLKSYEQQKELMDNSGCPMAENATCKFLKKAVNEAGKIFDTKAGIKIYETAMQEAEKEFQDFNEDCEKRIAAIGYDKEVVKAVTIKIDELVKYESMKKQADENKVRIARLEAERETNDKTITSCIENGTELILRAQEVTKKVDSLSKSVNAYQGLKEEHEKLKKYAERESDIPVYEERRQNTEIRLNELKKEYESVDEKCFQIMANILAVDEKIKESNTGIEEQLMRIEVEITDITQQLTRFYSTKGALQQKVEDVQKMREEVNELSKGIEVSAGLATKYEILKQAFSQDGVPHQIIRNIIHHITDVANNILGCDIASMNPGRLYVNGNYIECYICGINPDEWVTGCNTLDVELLIAVEYPFWLLDKEYVFPVSGQISKGNYKYPLKYPWRYPNMVRPQVE